MIIWPDLKLPPINLWSLPYAEKKIMQSKRDYVKQCWIDAGEPDNFVMYDNVILPAPFPFGVKNEELYSINTDWIYTDRGWVFRSKTSSYKKSIDDVTPKEWDSLHEINKESDKNQIGGTHYTDMKIQPWELMKSVNTIEEYTAYHINTVIGYLMRHKAKGGLQDIKKARHHLDELINYLEGK